MSSYRDGMRAYREATRLSPAAAARVRAQVEAGRASGSGRWWLPAAGGLLAAAAAVFVLAPEAPPEPVAHSFEAPVEAVATASVAAVAPVAVSEDVSLRPAGRGKVTGDARNVHVAWEGGTIAVDVTPDQGIRLDVTTDEAVVRVVGTGFDVTRDALGTRVEVRHGKVQVDCASGRSELIETGGSLTCLPGTAAGMLGRARALQDQGAALPVQMETIGAGLALAEPGPVRAELQGLELAALLRGGESDRALTLAEAMLHDGTTLRRVETLQVAARLRLLADDCAGARPWLAELDAAGALPADDPGRARCGAGE